MACTFQYYEDEQEYYARIYCKLTGKWCMYAKRCDRVNKYVPNEREKECYIYNMEMKNRVPEGSYFVQTSRKGKNGKLYIYVVYGDRSKKIATDLESIEQNYVYLREGKDKNFEVSLVPFPKEKKVKKSVKKSYPADEEKEKQNEE